MRRASPYVANPVASATDFARVHATTVTTTTSTASAATTCVGRIHRDRGDE
jgi:hypothetical protein